MEPRLNGKIALVTGATQGIGLAIAQGLVAAGCSVMITGRDQAKGDVAARAIGPQAFCLAAELADLSAPETLVNACLTRFGRIDILVNAAAMTDRATFLTATPDLWAKLFAVNARAPFFLMQHAIAAMKTQGGGSIVNILSMNAHCGTPELAVYSATKGAMSTLTKNAANAHRFDRIRVNGINVGWTDTPAERVMQAQTLGKGEGWLAEVSAARPFGRLFSVEDIANLAVFLASDAAGPMTGALIDQEQWVVGAAT